MRHIRVIGIGAGNPQHITLEAISALQGADAVLALDKGEIKADLLQLRQLIVDTHAPEVPIVTVDDPPRDRYPRNYSSEVRRWHQARAQLLNDALVNAVSEDGTAAFLVWGDPSLYDSTLRIIDHMRETCGLECDVSVVPGVTAVQVLTAAHGITINRIGEAIHITTGRNLHATSEKDRRNCVVMLDGGTAWQDAHTEHTYIWWGAYLGTSQQELRYGYVKDVGDEIAGLKASLREEHGWIMDTYLLREVD